MFTLQLSPTKPSLMDTVHLYLVNLDILHII